VSVRSRPLTWDGRELFLGAERVESVRWSAGDPVDLSPPALGAAVACHWDWVCDTLTPSQVDELATRNAHQLTALAAA